MKLWLHGDNKDSVWRTTSVQIDFSGACSALGDGWLLLPFPDFPSFCAQSSCAPLFALITWAFFFFFLCFGPSAQNCPSPTSHPATFPWLNPTLLQCQSRGSLLHKTSVSPRLGQESCQCSQNAQRFPTGTTTVPLPYAAALSGSPQGRPLRLPHGLCYPWDTCIHQDTGTEEAISEYKEWMKVKQTGYQLMRCIYAHKMLAMITFVPCSWTGFHNGQLDYNALQE